MPAASVDGEVEETHFLRLSLELSPQSLWMLSHSSDECLHLRVQQRWFDNRQQLAKQHAILTDPRHFEDYVSVCFVPAQTKDELFVVNKDDLSLSHDESFGGSDHLLQTLLNEAMHMVKQHTAVSDMHSSLMQGLSATITTRTITKARSACQRGLHSSDETVDVLVLVSVSVFVSPEQ